MPDQRNHKVVEKFETSEEHICFYWILPLLLFPFVKIACVEWDLEDLLWDAYKRYKAYKIEEK